MHCIYLVYEAKFAKCYSLYQFLYSLFLNEQVLWCNISDMFDYLDNNEIRITLVLYI